MNDVHTNYIYKESCVVGHFYRLLLHLFALPVLGRAINLLLSVYVSVLFFHFSITCSWGIFFLMWGCNFTVCSIYVTLFVTVRDFGC